MRNVVVVAGIVIGVALAGCADSPRAELARQAQTALVGMPKAELLSCAGAPMRQATAAGREYYTYVRNSGYSSGSSGSVGLGGFGGNVGLGLGLGFPLGGGSSGTCEATFVLQNGVVQQVNYPAGGSLPECGGIVRNCMPPPR